MSELLSPAGHHLLDRRRFLSSSATALGSIASVSYTHLTLPTSDLV